ncbi:MAG: hypothetical protein KC589_07620, partial [Nanoarchaeota archaeon]|nr:hypothetical protein [Nanoarchaeota archaeon]
ILLILVFGGIIWADSNGVWVFAEDIRPGIFGGDEGNGNYTFNSVVKSNNSIWAREFCDENGLNCNNILSSSGIGNNSGLGVRVASGQDVYGADLHTNLEIIDLETYGFDLLGPDPHILVSEHNYNVNSVHGNTMDASYCGFTKLSKLKFQVTCWASTNPSSSAYTSSFDWIAIQVSNNSGGSVGGSIEVDYSNCYSAPDLGAAGNTANPWGVMVNTNFACVNNSVLVGIDSEEVSNVVCCKLKIV